MFLAGNGKALYRAAMELISLLACTGEAAGKTLIEQKW
jgi:hypothetical protein